MTPVEVDRFFNKMGQKDIKKRIFLYSQLVKEIEPTFSSEGYAKATIVGMIASHLNITNTPLHQHVTKVVMRYPLTFFMQLENVTAIVDGYADFVKKLRELSITETGIPYV